MGRRKVNAEIIDIAPEVDVEAYLSSIASVRSAVEAACLDEGTTFKSMGSFGDNAFYRPLMMVAGQMKAVMWAVERWAFRAKWMKHIDRELSLICSDKTLPKDMRFAEISRRLSKCKPYDASYCRAFRSVNVDLDSLLEAVTALISFISLICEEGNFRAFDRSQYLGAYNHEIASGGEEISMASSHNFQTDFSSYPKFGYSSIHASSPTPPPHPATPTWKISLADKYALDKLYVGSAELEVFAKTLDHALVTRAEIENTLNSVNDLADLADEMLEVFEDWNGRCELWEIHNMPELDGAAWEDAIVSETEW